MEILGKLFFFAGLLCILFHFVVTAETKCLQQRDICYSSGSKSAPRECCPGLECRTHPASYGECRKAGDCCSGLACRAHPSTYYEVKFCFPPDMDLLKDYEAETTTEGVMSHSPQDGSDPPCKGLKCQPVDDGSGCVHECGVESVPQDVGWTVDTSSCITFGLLTVVASLVVLAFITATCSIIYVTRSKRKRAEKIKTIVDKDII